MRNFRWPLALALGVCSGMGTITLAHVPNLPPLPPLPQQCPTCNLPQQLPPGPPQFPNLNTDLTVRTIDTSTFQAAQAATRPQLIALRQTEPAAIFRASISAPPDRAEHADQLKREAANLLINISNLLGEADDGSFLEARRLAGELAHVERQLQALHLEDEEARQRRQRYINNLPVDSTTYEVHGSDDTAKQCEDEVKTSIEKVPVSAGFDSNGNAVYKMDWDVVPHKVRVCH